MTRLFIDGKEVILSSDFELDLYRENPFLPVTEIIRMILMSICMFHRIACYTKV